MNRFNEAKIRRHTSKQAQERDRTADLVLTKDVLYRLSYLGKWRRWCISAPRQPSLLPPCLWTSRQTQDGAGNGTRTRDPKLGRLALYQLSYSRVMKSGGEGRIRTFEGIAGRFTVCSLWPLGNLSYPFNPG